VLHLVVALSDGSPGTICADATGVFGDGLQVPGGPGGTALTTISRYLGVLGAHTPKQDAEELACHEVKEGKGHRRIVLGRIVAAQLARPGF
jgi:hypothetical protein